MPENPESLHAGFTIKRDRIVMINNMIAYEKQIEKRMDDDNRERLQPELEKVREARKLIESVKPFVGKIVWRPSEEEVRIAREEAKRRHEWEVKVGLSR